MGHTPHELAAEFPEYAERISVLKFQDPRFARMAESYHYLNREVHRAETNIEPMDGLAEVNLRKKRAALKDQIFRALKNAGEIERLN